MKKILLRLLVLLLAVTSVFGLTGLKSVQAAKNQYGGFDITTVSIRSGEDDFTGIRFTTTVSQNAYSKIMTYHGDKEVKFGTMFTDANGEDPVYICNVSTAGGNGMMKPTGPFEYHAAITFNDKVFALDVLAKVTEDPELASEINALTESEKIAYFDNYATQLAEIQDTIDAYRAASYAELIMATSYYEISGEKYFTNSVTRSMRMVANYYVNETNVELPEGFEAKNYFVAGEVKTGYLEEDDKAITVDGLDLSKIDEIAYGHENIPFTVKGNEIILESIPAGVQKATASSLGSATFYAFDAQNKVTTLNLTCVTKFISTKEDLAYFDVVHKFNQEYYISLGDDVDAKKAYLAKCQDDPYTYFNGYYLMTNNIDATGLKLTHNALVYQYDKTGNTNGFNGFTSVTVDGTSYGVPTKLVGVIADEDQNKYVPLNPLAQDFDNDGKVEDYELDYVFPRDGYPLVATYNTRTADDTRLGGYLYTSLLSNNTRNNFDNLGFYGTFDGQGYVIENFTSDKTSITAKLYEGTSESYTNTDATYGKTGPGIFGLINSNSVIKNVAFDNFNGAGAAFAGHLNLPYNGFNAGDHWKSSTAVRAKFENIYVEYMGTIAYGIIYRTHTGRSGNFVNMFIEANNLRSSSPVLHHPSEMENGLLGGQQWHNVKPGWNDFVMAHSHLYISVKGYKATNDDNYYLVWANSPTENIYTKNISVSGATYDTIGAAFKDLPYWTVVDTNGDGELGAYDLVHWHTIAPSVELSVSSIEFNSEVREAEISTTINGISMKPDSIEFDKNIFSYENGKITLNSYVSGTFNATVKYYGKELPLTINVANMAKTAYLSQVDGEIVGHGFTDLKALNGASISIDGKSTTVSVLNNKLYIDNYSDSTVLTKMGTKTAVLDTDAIDYNLTFNYVTKAIDEASDLTYFNVGYTFDEAYYNTLDDAGKATYLAEKQKSPFNYYDGYYVLVNDIDASGEVFNHEAVVAPVTQKIGDATYTKYGFAGSSSGFVTTNSLNATAAQITIGSTTYNVPRPGYPVLYNMQGLNSAVKVGFRGTFDGQGHIIYNLNDTARPTYTYNTDTGTAQTTSIGAGLFGVLQRPAIIQNVAFYNMNVGNSSGLSMYNAGGGNSSGGRVMIQNVFIKTATSANNNGIISAQAGSAAGLAMRWVVIDATSHTAKSSVAGLTGGIQGGEYTWPNNGSNCSFVRLTYIAAKYSAVEVRHPSLEQSSSYTAWSSHIFNAVHQGAYAAVTNFPQNYVDLCASADWNGTTTDPSDDISMVQAFSGNVAVNSQHGNFSGDFSSYWTNVNGLIYWNGLANKYINLTTENVTISNEDTSAAVNLVDPAGNVVEVEAEDVTVSDANVLEYVDGKVVLKDCVAGNYTVEFKFDGKVYQVNVTVKKYAYLSQVDGEVVLHGLTEAELAELDGTATIDGASTTASVVGDKLYIDLETAGVSQSQVLTGITTKEVTIGNVGYTLRYVSKAIDEGKDLEFFNTTYKFTQAKYEELLAAGDETATKAYLDACAADPFTHFDGYYVLVDDVDAKGITLRHEAFMNRLPTKSVSYTLNGTGKTYSWINGEIGFIADDINNKYVAVNPNAPITFGELVYNIPRDGYPLVGNYTAITNNETVTNTDPMLTGKVYTMANIGISYCYFDRIGFYGTFDGQGYVISNFDSDYAAYAYKKGTTDTTVSCFGPGLFGVTSAGSVVKNVAFNNFSGSGSAIAGYSGSNTSTAADDVWSDTNAYKYKQGTARALYENIYVHYKDTIAYGLLYRTNIGSGTQFKNVFINAPKVTAVEVTTGQKECGLLGSSSWMNNGAGNSASPKITNAYVLAGVASSGSVGWSNGGWQEIVWSVGELSDLYANATSTYNTAHKTIGEVFSTLPYWTVVDTNGDGVKGAGDAVYWARLAPEA